MNQNSGVNFQNFSEKKTTSPGRTKPKCLEVSYQEFSLYLIFLPECLVKWFAFQKFPQFSYCLKTFPGHNLHTICPFLENFQNFPSSGNYPKSNLLTDLQTVKVHHNVTVLYMSFLLLFSFSPANVHHYKGDQETREW